jgi:hypothetical protein
MRSKPTWRTRRERERRWKRRKAIAAIAAQFTGMMVAAVVFGILFGAAFAGP